MNKLIQLFSFMILIVVLFTACSAQSSDETVDQSTTVSEEKSAPTVEEESSTSDEEAPAPSVKEDTDTSDEAESSSSADEELTFTLEELATYNGKDGNAAYVAVDGIVYDVTDIPAWTGGKHNGNMAGQDVTQAIAKAPHGTSKLELLIVVGTLVD